MRNQLTWVTDALSVVWALLERYGWYVLAAVLLTYVYGPSILDQATLTAKKLTYNSRVAAEREREYEEERRRRIEDMQAQIRIDAERAAEERQKKEAEGLLKPRAEMPGADEQTPKNKRDYNPLMGDSSKAARITNTMRQRRGGG